MGKSMYWEDARSNYNYELGLAVGSGYVDILKELKEGYGLTAKDAETSKEYSFRSLT